MTILGNEKVSDMTREEAIRRIKAWNLDSDDREVLAVIIPELAESEDELIRKRLINLIRELAESKIPIMTSGYFVDGQDKKYIAYLEKQKGQKSWKVGANAYFTPEQKPNSMEDMPYITDEHFYEREPADSFKYKLAEYMTKCCTKKEGPYGYTYGISAETILKMAEEELLKRGVVQKPVEPSNDDLQRHQDELYDFKVFAAKQAREHHISFVHDFEWNNFCGELLSYFNEKQKPAEWSEEDEECRKEIIEYIEQRLGDGTSGQALWKKWHSWLKSLPERFNLLLNNEWSEEDEAELNNILAFIKNDIPISGDTRREFYSFLESLRPQDIRQLCKR